MGAWPTSTRHPATPGTSTSTAAVPVQVPVHRRRVRHGSVSPAGVTTRADLAQLGGGAARPAPSRGDLPSPYTSASNTVGTSHETGGSGNNTGRPDAEEAFRQAGPVGGISHIPPIGQRPAPRERHRAVLVVDVPGVDVAHAWFSEFPTGRELDGKRRGGHARHHPGEEPCRASSSGSVASPP